MFRSSLVKKDFSPEFRAFIKDQGIHHVVIDMQGTKKVEISESIVRSVLEVALNEGNHPLLIHCNHGKVANTGTIHVTIAYLLYSTELVAP
jgi:tyrosine-protein phosphatase SIW14